MTDHGGMWIPPWIPLEKPSAMGANMQKKAEQPTQNIGPGLRSCDKPMSDEQLAEVEALVPVYDSTYGVETALSFRVRSLIAEIRRLRRENHLLTLSRGVPSVVGRD